MITVVGLDGAGLSLAARTAVSSASVVIGSARQLALAGDPATGQPLPTGTPLSSRLAQLPDGAVVLASGDPGFFGVVRAVRAALGPAGTAGDRSLRVLPALSSVTQIFARLGLPWDDAVVVSAHGRPPGPVLAACLALPKVAVLTGPGCGPDVVGRALSGTGRALTVGVALGLPDEEVHELTPEQAAGRPWPDLAVVVVRDLAASPAPVGAAWPRPLPMEGGWALPEEVFAHRDGMLTKAEVRALTLARLSPGPGRWVWDIGAGSGSVAVECARFGAAVIAVEADRAALPALRANAERHAVRLLVVAGTAPECLTELGHLPAPDAVHLGGGGARLGALIDAAAGAGAATVVVPLASLDRVADAHSRLTDHGYLTDGVLLSASRLVALGSGLRLAPQNPTFLVWGQRAGTGAAAPLPGAAGGPA